MEVAWKGRLPFTLEVGSLVAVAVGFTNGMQLRQHERWQAIVTGHEGPRQGWHPMPGDKISVQLDGSGEFAIMYAQDVAPLPQVARGFLNPALGVGIPILALNRTGQYEECFVEDIRQGAPLGQAGHVVLLESSMPDGVTSSDQHGWRIRIRFGPPQHAAAGFGPQRPGGPPPAVGSHWIGFQQTLPSPRVLQGLGGTMPGNSGKQPPRPPVPGLADPARAFAQPYAASSPATQPLKPKRAYTYNVGQCRPKSQAASAAAAQAALKVADHAAMVTSRTKAYVRPHRAVCDASGMDPIIGPRFNKKGADYDLCEAEFAKLDESEKVGYVRIDHAGAPPINMATGGVYTYLPSHLPKGARVGGGLSPSLSACFELK